MDTPSGIKDSIPAWIKYSVQTPGDIPYNGIYYDPPEEVFYFVFCAFRFHIFLIGKKIMICFSHEASKLLFQAVPLLICCWHLNFLFTNQL